MPVGISKPNEKHLQWPHSQKMQTEYKQILLFAPNRGKKELSKTQIGENRNAQKMAYGNWQLPVAVQTGS